MTFPSAAQRARAGYRGARLTDQQIDTMRTWRAAGQSYKQLSWFFKVSVRTVRYHCDGKVDENKEEERRLAAVKSEILAQDNPRAMADRKKIEKDAMLLKREIPKDTRSFTGRFMGDPVFERSALYRKQQEGAQQ